METLEKQLVKDYGMLSPDWIISLKLLGDQLELYLNSRDEIKKTGLTVFDSKGRVTRSPLIPSMNNALAYILKILHSFGSSPMAKSKI